MTHRHTYHPVMTRTLTLPTPAGHYEALQVFRCACGRYDAWSIVVTNRRPMPTHTEIEGVRRWQENHPEAYRKLRAL